MIIKVTDKNSGIASVHRGEINNVIKLYQVISTIVGEYHWIFSEPIIEGDKIKWQTQIEATPISYVDADAGTQELIRNTLKEVIYSILYGKRGEQFDFLKSAFEIPSPEDIFYIGGKVVLTQWGHIKSRFDAKRGIIFDLIGEEGARLKIKLLRDFLPEDSTPINVTFDGYSFEATTNINGEVELFLPSGVDIDIKILDEFDERIKLRKGLNTLEIDLGLLESEPPEREIEELPEPEPEPEPEPPAPQVEIEKAPFVVEVWDCQNDAPILGEGELIIKVGDETFHQKIEEGRVEIEEWFEEEILIDSAVKGFIIKEQKIFTPKSGESKRLCLEPMIELKKEGATGDPRFNISWKPSEEDIDIMVVTPCQELIYYHDKVKECKGFEGRLDIDIREEECKRRRENCQENITFDNGGARGEYLIIIKKYAGTSSPTDITLTIINNGEKEVKEFTLYRVDDEKRFKIIH